LALRCLSFPYSYRPLPLPRSRCPLRAWRSLRLRNASTYSNRRLWITFWRRFWGGFLGDFLGPTGLGAGVRPATARAVPVPGGDFSADGGLLVRWASADLGPFSTFFAFLDRFLPVFGHYFALFPSMPCAYLYVHNFRRTRVTLLRRGYGGQDGGQALNLELPSTPCAVDLGLWTLDFGLGTLDCGYAAGGSTMRNAELGTRNGRRTANRVPLTLDIGP